MQKMPPFYLLFRNMAANLDVGSQEEPTPSLNDQIVNAMQSFDKAQRVELAKFCDRLLSAGADSKALAQVFEDGHLHHVWRTADGPRQYLMLIRNLAETDG